MASSGSRPFARLWPFMLSWMTKQARPTNFAHRRIEEYLAGIGMMQANEERRKQGHPVFNHAMILTGLHESFSDDIPHITIAAATDRMREENQHLAIHCQATSVDWEVAQYLGIKTYEENVRGDEELIWSSFAKPLRTGTSLMSDDNTSARVGCTVDSGPPRWYILNDQQDIIYIEPQTFYTVGKGSTSYLAFLHPILQQPCRAIFLGNERPVPHSPDPEPTNLEANMTLLSLESSHRQSVVPYVKFGKDMQRPVRFQTSLDDKVFKTRWESWEFQSAVFRLQPKDGKYIGHEFWATDMPVERVAPWFQASSRSPIHFKSADLTVFKTKRNQWRNGLNDTFFVFLHQAKFYMAFNLLDESGGGVDNVPDDEGNSDGHRDN